MHYTVHRQTMGVRIVEKADASITHICGSLLSGPLRKGQILHAIVIPIARLLQYTMDILERVIHPSTINIRFYIYNSYTSLICSSFPLINTPFPSYPTSIVYNSYHIVYIGYTKQEPAHFGFYGKTNFSASDTQQFLYNIWKILLRLCLRTLCVKCLQ